MIQQALSYLKTYFSKPTSFERHKNGEWLPPPPLSMDRWLVLSPPGHGKTCFLLAACVQLKIMNQRSIAMINWSDRTKLDQIEAKIATGKLEGPTLEQSSSIECELILRSGERFTIRFVDRRDEALSPDGGKPPDSFSWGHTLVVLLDPEEWLSKITPDLGLARFGLRLAELTSAWSTQKPVQIILVIQRADKILDLPLDVRHHLTSDPLGEAPDLPSEASLSSGLDPAEPLLSADYKRLLEHNSSLLEEWLRTKTRGSRLFEIAGDYNWDLRICAASAIGSSPAQNQGRLILPWAPKRVLDPFIWTLPAQPPMHHQWPAFDSQ